MYAIVDGGGRQVRVEEGARLVLDRRASEKGEVVLDRVLLVSDGKDVRIGRPYLEGARVRCRVLGHRRGRKVLVFRYKPKKGVRRKTGFRPALTDVVVERIEVPAA